MVCRLLVSVIIPCLNEVDNVESIVNRLKSALRFSHSFELVFVDDGSTDETFSVLQELALTDDAIKIIRLSRNFGHQSALWAGLTYAKGDAVVFIDADLQDPPEVIPKLVSEWEKGFLIVNARRRSRSGETKFKLMTANAFYTLFNYLTGTSAPKNVGDFKLIDRKVVDVLLKMPEKHRYIRGMVAWTGFKSICVDYDRAPRVSGETKYPLSKMLVFATNAVISFSSKPLRLTITVAVLMFILGLFGISYALVKWIIGDPVRGWTLMFVSLMMFGAIQNFILAVLGEYISKIYETAKDRPSFVITEAVNIEEIS